MDDYENEFLDNVDVANDIKSAKKPVKEGRKGDEVDAKFGFVRFKEGKTRVGFLISMRPTVIEDSESNVTKAALDLYFEKQDGERFKASVEYQPYFYVGVSKQEHYGEVESYLKRRYERHIVSIQQIQKEDLQLKNHLTGLKKIYLRVNFMTVQSLLAVRDELTPMIKKNRERQGLADVYSSSANGISSEDTSTDFTGNKMKKRDTSRAFLDSIVDIREYDVPYYMRVSIDKDIRCGNWYNVSVREGKVELEKRKELVVRPDPRVLAFDIETTKLPLKFPDAKIDHIMMISYMIDGQGYLIVNREIVSKDIDDFEYTPKPEYEGAFTVTNVPNELELLRSFMKHARESKPTIYVTFNGDNFDWPFVAARAKLYGIYLFEELGVFEDQGSAGATEYKCRYGAHMDIFRWVVRDSYLPHGSQGLKAVTKAKLGYNPLELDPEDMIRFAAEQPQKLASYSVSDAVATFYLYQKFVHPFIFSLCNIIPMNPDDVLRKGTGTLCESLLMAEAFSGNIIYPNKQVTEQSKMHKGHLIESETYVGASVEALESGVFRNDIPYKFDLDPVVLQKIIDEIDSILLFAIEVEAGMKKEHVTNYKEVRDQITSKLEVLRDTPKRKEQPNIYHLDVGAMYPNIILTNRLQPSAIVSDEVCAACDFNRPESKCQRKMGWLWKGDYVPANRSEYDLIKSQLESERFPVKSKPKKPEDNSKPSFFSGKFNKQSTDSNKQTNTEVDGNDNSFKKSKFSEGNGATLGYYELSSAEQASLLKSRLKDYSKKVYKVNHRVEIEEKESTVCMRENPFYVDTIRSFRDRRYEYKRKHKDAQKYLEKVQEDEEKAVEVPEAQKLVTLYDSLQLAHKCILNSFYGYVMRKGARWHSMEMAGIVTYTGVQIITEARKVVEAVGRPLELDTDGIWCALPSSFPQNYKFNSLDPKNPSATKTYAFSFPCILLNKTVATGFTNPQYQDLVNASNHSYSVRSECTIFFEVDGPYKAMILPAAKEEGKKLKKRYAVFHLNGSLAELKGFEIKRRGELKLIKSFQGQIFEKFLEGNSLSECYRSVASVANSWLDILDSRGIQLPESELLELLTESSNMSKKLEEYGSKKSCAITAAKRLADFLGEQMVKEKGLACAYIISKYPVGTPVTDRVIPAAIFNINDEAVKSSFIRKWCRSQNSNGEDTNVRSLIDWDYYKDRLASVIQKIITIPACMQNIENPVPRIPNPAWLEKSLKQDSASNKQGRISDLFIKTTKESSIQDIENIGQRIFNKNLPPRVNKRIKPDEDEIVQDEPDDEETTKPQDEYESWLIEQKKTWRAQLENRKKKRVFFTNDNNTNVPVSRPSGKSTKASKKQIGGLVHQGTLNYRQQRQSLLKVLINNPLEIIQIAETENVGEFIMWTLIDGSYLHPVNLKILKRFYINSHIPDESNFGKKVMYHLPRSKARDHLYEYNFDESDIKLNSKTLTNLSNGPEVEGVYETSVPSLFRAIVQLGNLCTFSPQARKRITASLNSMSKASDKEKDWFSLDDLEMKETSINKYLKTNNLKHLFMYHSFSGANKGNEFGVFAIIFPSTNDSSSENNEQEEETANQSSVSKAHFVFVRGAASVTKEYLAEKLRSSSAQMGHKTSNWNVEIITGNAKQCLSAVDNILSSYKRKGSLVVNLQSGRKCYELQQQLPTLKEMPVITIPHNQKDNQYPPLSWEAFAATLAINRFFSVEKLEKLLVEYARYSKIPIGNLSTEQDYAIFMTDVQFARYLKQSNQILWMSESALPDLGGSELVDFSFAEEGEHPEINEPGSYQTVSIELDLVGLATNTILEANKINELEGGANLLTIGMNSAISVQEEANKSLATKLRSLDETFACINVFKVLKSLIAQWSCDLATSISDASENTEISPPDMLLSHFFRWISSPQSKLYDPALHKLLLHLMSKVFWQLIADFRKLGSKIIYASFNKIIINTAKRSISDAFAYNEFILQNIKQKELFSWLYIEPNRYWLSLIFLDNSNFGGILHEVSNSNSQNESENKIISNWNINEHLPKQIQPHFLLIISDFILQVFKQRNFSEEPSMKSEEKETSDKSTSLRDSGVISETYLTPSTLINSYLHQKMFKIIEDIRNTLSGQVDEDSEDSENSIPAVAPKSANPALDFIKSVCHVLALDSTLQGDVFRLRKALLRMIHVREFAQDAEFVNPCISYVLTDVTCSFCNSSRDMDLLRDPNLALPKWTCKFCGHLYDKSSIEARLVEVVQKMSLSYQIQDLVCEKCKQVKADNMSDICEQCSGKFVCKFPYSELTKRLRVFNTIALFHKFPYLQEVTEFLL